MTDASSSAAGTGTRSGGGATGADGAAGNGENESPKGNAQARDNSNADAAASGRVQLHAARGGAQVTLDGKGGSLKNVRALEVPKSDAGAAMLPYGLFGFEVEVEPGASAEVDLTLPEDARPDHYFKHDPASGAISRFDYNGTTGAVIDDNVVTLHLVDGGRGDADGVANGLIVDPGGPGEGTSTGTGQIRVSCDSGLDDWDVSQSGGTADPGTVVHENGQLVMREGDSFQVLLERQVTVPSDPGLLTFDYTAEFDTGDPVFVNDAFEAVLVDADGYSLAPVIRPQRDALFNHTEQEPVSLGLATTVTDGTVDVDISHLEPGTAATLRFRLTNNDSDTDTTVRLGCGEQLAAADDSYQTDEDTTLEVPAPGVLANDTAASDPTKLTDPANGQLTLGSDGSLSYTPDEDFVGEDSFAYQVTDGSTATATATVTVTVNAVNDAPIATGDVYTTTENTAVQIGAVDGVLANDSDAEGEALDAVLVSGPNSGSVTLNLDGSLTYTPGTGFVGNDHFTYQARDTQGALSDVTAVQIQVGPEVYQVPGCAALFEIGNLPTVSYFHLRRFQNDPKTTLFLGCG